MVAAAIEDPDGRKFWTDYFIEKSPPQVEQKMDFVTLRVEVAWEKFIQKFANLLKIESDVLHDQLPSYLSDTPLPAEPKLSQIQQATEDVLKTWATISEKNKQIVDEEFNRRGALLKLNCLKFFLADVDGGVESVSLLRFGKIIDIFGPIKIAGPKEPTMLDKVR